MEDQNKLQPEDKREDKKTSAAGHGRNWITDMYDKVNVSVDTLNIILIGLMIFIIAVIVLASRH